MRSLPMSLAIKVMQENTVDCASTESRLISTLDCHAPRNESKIVYQPRLSTGDKVDLVNKPVMALLTPLNAPFTFISYQSIFYVFLIPFLVLKQRYLNQIKAN